MHADAVQTASEGRVLSFLVDDKLSTKARKVKVDNAFATIKKQNREYQMEIQLHPVIHQQAMSCLLGSG